MRLDIREFPVRKTGRFTHVSSKLRGLVRGKRFISYGRRNWGGERFPGIERQCNMADRKREIA